MFKTCSKQYLSAVLNQPKPKLSGAMTEKCHQAEHKTLSDLTKRYSFVDTEEKIVSLRHRPALAGV